MTPIAPSVKAVGPQLSNRLGNGVEPHDQNRGFTSVLGIFLTSFSGFSKKFCDLKPSYRDQILKHQYSVFAQNSLNLAAYVTLTKREP